MHAASKSSARQQRTTLSRAIARVLHTGTSSAIIAGCLTTSAIAGIAERSNAIQVINDAATVSVDQTVSINVLSNDTGSVNSNTLSLATANTTQGGTVLISADGATVTYTPPAGFTGEDTFFYEVTEQDWRGTNTYSEQALSAGNPASEDVNGNKIYPAPTLTGEWNANRGDAPQQTYIGTLVKPAGTQPGCYNNDNARVNVTANWEISKHSGQQNGYEASITTKVTNPETESKIEDWDINDFFKNKPLVNDTAQGLTGAQFNALQYGLFAQNSDNKGYHDWVVKPVTFDIAVDTSGCSLFTGKAMVTITIDNDADKDNVPNVIDLDDDNDGIPDSVEGTDDRDGDGTPNHLDLDSDNDGLPDVIEANGFDTDRDGIIDNFVDANGDGQHDSNTLSLVDTDKDKVADLFDIDSDNDGVPDVVESAGTDANGDGRIDEPAVLVAIDRDNDNVPNYRDLDSDGDSFFDVTEAGGAKYDVNADGILDPMTDTDGDGIQDSIDVDQTNGQDSDGDQIDDKGDADLDPAQADADKDGISDATDPDANGDGMYDALNTATGGEALPLPDSNNNGNPDFTDPTNGQDDTGDGSGTLKTGLDGSGGCTLSTRSPFDPTLPLLVTGAALFLLRRKQKQTH